VSTDNNEENDDPNIEELVPLSDTEENDLFSIPGQIGTPESMSSSSSSDASSGQLYSNPAILSEIVIVCCV
jgi:hypothetical protein